VIAVYAQGFGSCPKKLSGQIINFVSVSFLFQWSFTWK